MSAFIRNSTQKQTGDSAKLPAIQPVLLSSSGQFEKLPTRSNLPKSNHFGLLLVAVGGSQLGYVMQFFGKDRRDSFSQNSSETNPSCWNGIRPSCNFNLSRARSPNCFLPSATTDQHWAQKFSRHSKLANTTKTDVVGETHPLPLDYRKALAGRHIT